MSDHSLAPKFFLREEVNRTESRLRRAGYTVNSGKIIADLNFGFGRHSLKKSTLPYYWENRYGFLPRYPLPKKESICTTIFLKYEI
jgi:hypothetical protein